MLDKLSRIDQLMDDVRNSHHEARDEAKAAALDLVKALRAAFGETGRRIKRDTDGMFADNPDTWNVLIDFPHGAQVYFAITLVNGEWRVKLANTESPLSGLTKELITAVEADLREQFWDSLN